MHHQTRSLFALSVFALGLSASAQIAGNLLYDANTRVFFQQAEQPVKATIQGNMLVLEVNAMMNARADSYLAIFHVSQVGQTAEEADSLINERIDGMQARLKRDKLKVDDVFIDMLSFVPVFEYETLRKGWSKYYQEIPAGFEIQKNIHVRFSDAKVLDRIVTAAAKEEIYDLVKVDYSVRDQGACLDTLRTIAFRAMQKKLDAFGKLGMKLEESHRNAAEQNAAFFPLERYRDYQAHSSMSLNSKRRGQAVNDIRKPKTMFYNKVPYGRFDIVLHPDITEPPVQYTYNLVLQCQLPPAFQAKDVKELVKYVWLTDKGDMRELQLP
ncbi:MAG: SIMPL domain-containing protein [Flavobacteriales bacterium]|nr:SIMPL domain-containing protein [Flavobacteriales bacterium]MCC6936893.1 SIMPL domain-containing protein [Flavobacteriales bacterium]